jgi:hypothetical protein
MSMDRFTQVHTNGLENFWSLLKRGSSGTYVRVEPSHLFRYLDEQAYRYNNRKDATDFDGFRMATAQIVGKRLTWKQVIGCKNLRRGRTEKERQRQGRGKR